VSTEQSFTGTEDDDDFTGTSGNDNFNMRQGGSDDVNGAGGDDHFFFGIALSSQDKVDGGSGADTVEIEGDDRAPGGIYTVLFQANSIKNVETLQLNGGEDFSAYQIALNDANIDSGDTLTVRTDIPGMTQDIFLDADFETDGHVNFFGGNGNDNILMGANFEVTDQLNGGGGTNFLTLHGDYADGLELNATSIVNFFEIAVVPNFDYAITTDDATCANNRTLIVNGVDLKSGDTLFVDASAETNGRIVVTGGAGNDTVILGNAVAQLAQADFTKGGNDTGTGGVGNDLFAMGGALNAGDRIDGGAGDDTLDLEGDYDSFLTLSAATIKNIETIALHAGGTYKLKLDDGNVAAGETLLVDGSELGASDEFRFTGTPEIDGILHVVGGAGADVISSGRGADTITLDRGGNDTADGGRGNDTFALGAALTSADKIDGALGADTVQLAGDYSAGVTFGATTMVNVDTLILGAGFDYKLTLNNATVAAGKTLAVDASGLDGSSALTFTGSAENDGRFDIAGGAGGDTVTGGQLDDLIDGGAGNDTLNGVAGDDRIEGGAGDDTLVGASGNDVLIGGAGKDRLEGGAAADDFKYGDVSESTGGIHDTLVGFDANVDDIDLAIAVTGIDAAVTEGELKPGKFNNTMANILGADALAPNHAVLVTPDEGALAGVTFLVVDINGEAGYQADADLVLRLENPANLGNLDLADFI
jgi:Ca2+-binding RTX toxin-like protein